MKPGDKVTITREFVAATRKAHKEAYDGVPFGRNTDDIGKTWTVYEVGEGAKEMPYYKCGDRYHIVSFEESAYWWAIPKERSLEEELLL